MSDDDTSLANISKIQRIEQHSHGLPQVPPPIQSTSPHQRLNNNHNNDFSGSVKRKLADSKRTGQACDRCKVRTDLLVFTPPAPWTRRCISRVRAQHQEKLCCCALSSARRLSRTRHRPRLRPTATSDCMRPAPANYSTTTYLVY